MRRYLRRPNEKTNHWMLFADADGIVRWWKEKADPFAALTEQIDSIKVHPDSIQDSTVVVEEQVPAAADESFADFFYNFASDEAFQRTRVVFPFSLYKGKQVTRIQKADWKFDPLFSREPAYTVLFDKEEDMEIEKDTSLHSVQVDWIFLTDRRIKRYYFQRKKIPGFGGHQCGKIAERRRWKGRFLCFL